MCIPNGQSPTNHNSGMGTRIGQPCRAVATGYTNSAKGSLPGVPKVLMQSCDHWGHQQCQRFVRQSMYNVDIWKYTTRVLPQLPTPPTTPSTLSHHHTLHNTPLYPPNNLSNSVIARWFLVQIGFKKLKLFSANCTFFACLFFRNLSCEITY